MAGGYKTEQTTPNQKIAEANKARLAAGDPLQSIGFNYGGQDFHYQNVGMMDPLKMNPYAASYLEQNRAMMDKFSESAAGGAFNPAFYDNLRKTQEAQVTASLANKMAQMGLSGSSMELGQMQQAIQGNQMAWLNRQQSDQMRAMQGMQALGQQGYGMAMGIQNQYGQFQDMANQTQLDLLGIQQAKQAQDNAALAGIAKGVIGAGAMVATGGAAAPAVLGGMAASSMSQSMPDLESGYWGSNPYQDEFNQSLGY